MGYDLLRVWAISGNQSRMLGLGISSGVEDTFMVKEECNLQMGYIVRVGRGTHIFIWR